MNINITGNDIINIITIVISSYSLFLSHKYKKEQQNLTKRKVWLEKQNEVLDKTLEKLTENFSKLVKTKPPIHKNKEDFEESIKVINEIYDNSLYIRANRHYYSENLDKQILEILKSISKFLEDIGEDNIKQQKYSNDLAKIGKQLTKINKTINKEFLYSE